MPRKLRFNFVEIPEKMTPPPFLVLLRTLKRSIGANLIFITIAGCCLCLEHAQADMTHDMDKTNKPNELVGSYCPPCLPGAKEDGGISLDGVKKYAISHVKYNNSDYLVLQQLESHDANGSAIHRYIYALRFDGEKSSEVIYSGCKYKAGVGMGGYVMGYGKWVYTGSGYKSLLKYAWKIDIIDKKLYELDINIVVCEIDGDID